MMSSNILNHRLWLITLALVTCSTHVAHSHDNPPEVQALIGTKIAPLIRQGQALPDKRAGDGNSRPTKKKVVGDIPGFKSINETLLTHDSVAFSIGLHEGFIYRTPGFITTRIYPDLNLEVMDVVALPPGIVEWRLVGETIVYISKRFRFSTYCESLEKPSGLDKYVRIVGLIKPERGKTDCGHDSTRVKRAWGVERDGRVVEIEANQLKCQYFAMNDC